jgi:hypothetical protein
MEYLAATAVVVDFKDKVDYKRPREWGKNIVYKQCAIIFRFGN